MCRHGLLLWAAGVKSRKTVFGQFGHLGQNWGMTEQLGSDQNERMVLMTDQVFELLRGKGLKRADVVLALRRDWKSIAPGRWVNARPIVLIEGCLSVIAPSKMEFGGASLQHTQFDEMYKREIRLRYGYGCKHTGPEPRRE